MVRSTVFLKVVVDAEGIVSAEAFADDIETGFRWEFARIVAVPSARPAPRWFRGVQKFFRFGKD